MQAGLRSALQCVKTAMTARMNWNFFWSSKGSRSKTERQSWKETGFDQAGLAVLLFVGAARVALETFSKAGLCCKVFIERS
jgi:hypothetical protein